jgi:hypothetical protein
MLVRGLFENLVSSFIAACSALEIGTDCLLYSVISLKWVFGPKMNVTETT